MNPTQHCILVLGDASFLLTNHAHSYKNIARILATFLVSYTKEGQYVHDMIHFHDNINQTFDAVAVVDESISVDFVDGASWGAPKQESVPDLDTVIRLFMNEIGVTSYTYRRLGLSSDSPMDDHYSLMVRVSEEREDQRK